MHKNKVDSREVCRWIIVAITPFVMYGFGKAMWDAQPIVEPISPLGVPSIQVEAKEPVERIVAVRQWTGKVSYYSHDGCLGCSANQTMANGKPFEEMAMTMAFNWLPLNTEVKITNLDNGKSTFATVTDRHGAYNEKYGWRMADLSKGLAEYLGASTDKSNILIQEVRHVFN